MLRRRWFSMAACSIAAGAASDEARAQTPGRPAAEPPGRPAAEPLDRLAAEPLDRLAALRERGELRACIWPDYYGISARNPRSSELEGLDIDLVKALAARLGVRLGFVETDFTGFMDRLTQGDCDVATMAAGITPERARRVAFTRPYLVSGAYAVTTKGNARIRAWADIDAAGTVVAVAAGTVIEPLMRRSLRRAELMVVAPPRTREAELLAGRADVFMTDYPYSRRLMALHAWVQVLEPPERFGETPYAWAVAPGDAAWLAVLNGFLNEARADGTLERSAARHGLAPILAPILAR